MAALGTAEAAGRHQRVWMVPAQKPQLLGEDRLVELTRLFEQRLVAQDVGQVEAQV